MHCQYNLFFFFKICFVYFWMCWVFVAACRLSLVAAREGYSLVAVSSLLIAWWLLLWCTGSRAHGLQYLWHVGLVAAWHVGSNLCPLLWLADS